MASMGDGFRLVNRFDWSVEEYSGSKFVAENIYDALVDGETLWLGSDQGLTRVNIEKLLNGDPDFVSLSRYSGLDRERVMYLAASANSIYAFNDVGFSVVPKQLESLRYSSASSPSFYLKAIFVNDAPVDQINQSLEFPYNQNNLTIDFGFVSFNNPRVFLRYRIVETDPWTYSQDRSLDFYSLAPGTYQFQLEYSTDNFHWTSAPQFPTITISPPWWQTWYFTATVVIVVLSFSAFYFRARMKVANERQRFLEANAHHQEALLQAEIESIEKERSRIAKDLHDGIGASVLALKLMVYEKLSQHADPELPEINLHFNELMSELKLIIHNLEPPGLDNHSLQEGLNEYVYRINAALKTRIQFSANGQPIQDPKVNTLMFRIVQELIANTLKHSETKKAEIKISKSTEQVVLDYRDEGRINIETRGRNGHGLLNIEARVKAMNGKLTIVGDEGFLCRVEIPLPNTLH
ncbi:MAG: histidine kinase [Cyclobacteriaceae bacterium]